MISAAPLRAARAPGALAAFRSRNFRLYFAGQAFSLTGTWMQRVAMGWLVYRLTASGLWLGVAEFCANFTSFLIAPFAGALSDRIDRHRILIVTQGFALVQAALLAALVLAGTPTLPAILGLALFQGIINGFDFPVRHSFAVELVEGKEDLPSAIALNSFVFNLARLLGPAAAGVAITAWGEGVCFLVNSVTFLPVILSLLLIRPRRAAAPPPAALLSGIRQGYAYAAAHPAIRPILVLLLVFSVAGMPYLALLPMFVREALLADAAAFGRLSSAAGLGALVGATFLASRRGVEGFASRIGIGAAAFGASLLLAAFTRHEALAAPLLALAGYESILVWVASNTLLQTVVDDRMRGRVMSFFIMSFLGGAPLGSLLFGALAERFGVRGSFALCGALCLLAGLLFLRGARADCYTSFMPLAAERGRDRRQA